jgi:hypothetical protein
MRDRLIELLKNAPLLDVLTDEEDWEISADYLLADGWMRPPLMVGQKVFGFSREMEITEITIHLDRYNSPFYKFEAHYEMNNGIYSFFFIEEDIGKEIFLTREDALAKLKEGSEDA